MCQLITDNEYGATNEYLYLNYANFKETEFQTEFLCNGFVIFVFHEAYEN